MPKDENRPSLRGVFVNGILNENPTFRLVLGTCPTIAVTTSAMNGLGMGLAATFVLIGSNVVIMPGVTIGENSVIGAGSVVTRNIPPNVVAFGAPCRVARPITEDDLKEYKKGYPVNEDWEG